MTSKQIVSPELFNVITQRLCFQLLENHDLEKDTILIGIQNNGAIFLRMLLNQFKNIDTSHNINYGFLDITFFRDDIRTNKEILIANKTDIPFSLENKNVVLIDDVLYTGRSVRSAMDALNSFGRPKSIHLLAMINRRFARELPIQADYIGMSVDTMNDEHVLVQMDIDHNNGEIFIEKN